MNMNQKKLSELKEKYLTEIVTASYGNLGPIKRFRFNRFLKKNPDAKIIYEDFKRTSDAVNEITSEKCPDRLVRKVYNQFGLSSKNPRSFINDVLLLVFSRPLFSSLSITIIIVGLLSTFILERNGFEVQYTRDEIGLADKQVKESLALISSILTKTESKLRNDILASRVGKPIKEGIKTINYLFIENGENKNEKDN